MAYELIYNGIEGQGGLYARIQRLLDGLWWDETGAAWVAAESAECNLDLIESVTEAGRYAVTAGLTPAKGGVYIVSIYTPANILLLRNDCPYRSKQLTVLQIINNVQRELRLPQTGEAAFPNNAHGQLLLGFLNKTMDLMMEHSPSAYLKISGAFQTVIGREFYPISAVNNSCGIDLINSLTVDDQSLGHTIYSRHGGTVIVKLTEVPTESKTAKFEGLLRVERLTAHTDIPLLDVDTIQLGVLWLAKYDQGEEYETDLAAFQAKISLHNPNGGAAGDVDFL